MAMIDDNYSGDATPVAKAFFDTALGRGCAVVLTLGGIAGAIAGIGNPLLAGSSFLLIASTLFRVGAPSGDTQNTYFPVISLAAAGLFAGSAGIVKTLAEEARIEALPAIDDAKSILASPKELYCHNNRGVIFGVIEVNDAKRGIVGKKLNCG